MTTTEEMTINEVKDLKAVAEAEILEIIKKLEANMDNYVTIVNLTRDYTFNPETTRTSGVSLSILI